MDNLQFIQRLYKGKFCYSDSMTEEQIALLHISSGVERIILRMVADNRLVFLTGNPGDGKTYIIKALRDRLGDIYIETDLNMLTNDELDGVLERLNTCYTQGKACIIAANEFPFHKLISRCRKSFPQLYADILTAKKNVLAYGNQTIDLKRICIVDLNERNLLDKDRCIVKQVLDRFTELLQPYCGSNPVLAENVKALTTELVQQQTLHIFTLISMSGEHFVIRDILGALSYILVSCISSDNYENAHYYDALFTGNNDLMAFASQFDPVLLSHPAWDEMLWNGEVTEGWQLDAPTRWPVELTKESDSVEDAVKLFKSIKRKFFFENAFAKELVALQPQYYSECIDILVKLKQDAHRIKRRLIRSMNKVCLSADTEGEFLRAWTVHSYDLSRTAGAAVSTRCIAADELELISPEPVSWLKEMEYVPSCIVMRSKKHPEVKLEIDMDLLRSLIMIDNGYPASLLSTQYEQVITQFVQALCASNVARDYSDGCILIANRHEGTHKRLRIEGNKYYLGKEEDY